MKINDIVIYKEKPYETYCIVGDKDTPYVKAIPYRPGGEIIKLKKGKDFIIIRKIDDNKFGDEAIQVSKSEIFKKNEN